MFTMDIMLFKVAKTFKLIIQRCTIYLLSDWKLYCKGKCWKI